MTEVIAIATAARLLQEGVKLSRIKRACAYLRSHLRLDDDETPLAHQSLFTDGRTVLVPTDNPQVAIDVADGGQLVLAMNLRDVATACHRAGLLRAPQRGAKRHAVTAVRIRWKTRAS